MAERPIHESEISLNAASAVRMAAEADKFKAESRLAEAQEKQMLLFARHTEAEVDIAMQRKLITGEELEQAKYATESVRIQIQELMRKEVQELARDKHHFFYNFDKDVDSRSVKECISQLSEWHRSSDPAYPPPIEVCFNSDGGDVVQGFALFDYIQRLRQEGHKITTSALGVAASMAGILLQAGDERVMGSQSWLMIHEGSFGVQGKIGDVQDTTDWVKAMQGRILDIFATRCQNSDAVEKLDKEELRSRWERRTWWISSDEALRFGLVDKVR